MGTRSVCEDPGSVNRLTPERARFKAFYAAHRVVHLVVTGIAVRVGNFSIVPAAQLERMVVMSEMWNH
jgi:hypothetical protein